MKIVFWICWIIDLLFLLFILSTLLKTYTSGMMANKSKEDVFNFILLAAGMIAVVISAIILYNNGWLKTATLFASIPVLTLLSIFLVPIIAYLSGQKMN